MNRYLRFYFFYLFFFGVPFGILVGISTVTLRLYPIISIYSFLLVQDWKVLGFWRASQLVKSCPAILLHTKRWFFKKKMDSSNITTTMRRTEKASIYYIRTSLGSKLLESLLKLLLVALRRPTTVQVWVKNANSSWWTCQRRLCFTDKVS